MRKMILRQYILIGQTYYRTTVLVETIADCDASSTAGIRNTFTINAKFTVREN